LKSLKLVSHVAHHLFGFAGICFAWLIGVGEKDMHAKREVLDTRLMHLTKHGKFQEIDCKRGF
jgi:hypothetical protein